MVKALRTAVRERLQEIANEELELAYERIESRIPGIIASVSLLLFSNVSYDRMQKNLVMTVKLDGLKK